MPNKITREAKSAIALAFEGLGEVEALIKWAGTSTRTRHRLLCTNLRKIVPFNVQAEVQAVAQNNDEPRQALQQILMRLIEQRRLQEQHAPSSCTSDQYPKLVVSRETAQT